jgi:hypothetical protein
METNQATTRPTTETEKDVFMYLNLLRLSGVTNMYGASPYITKEFNTSSKESIALLSLWMKNFNEHGNYEQVKI